MKFPRKLSKGTNNTVIVLNQRYLTKSALRSQVGEIIFEKYVENELKEIQEFKTYFFNR